MQCCDDSPVKKKKKKISNKVIKPKQCIIHIDHNADKTTLSQFNEQSWKTAVNASKRRNDGMLSNYNQLPNPLEFGKEKTCYNSYTNPRNLDKFSVIPTTNDDVRRQSSRGPTSNSTDSSLARKECIICRKTKTSKTGSGYETLIKCVTNASAIILLHHVNTINDE